MTTLDTIQTAERKVARLQTRLRYVERGLRSAEKLAGAADCARRNSRRVVVTTVVAVVGITVVAVVVRRRRRRRNDQR